ncbi:hypothetical protein EON83_22070 [bacterium]|nr:MAG: hypothetical protein EON83_22070 [bacterium]
MKKLRYACGMIILMGLVLGINHLKPEPFFSNLSLTIPSSTIVSHQSSGWLSDAEDHFLVLDIPNAQWPQVLAQFKATGPRRFSLANTQQVPGYSDVTPNLKNNYPDFRAGREWFFSALPAKATAGDFRALDKQKNKFRCRFLRDETTGRIWFLSRKIPNN